MTQASSTLAPKLQGDFNATPSRNAFPNSASEAAFDAPPAPRASGDGRSGEAALRLDIRTYLDREQGHFRLYMRDYGDGLAEIGWSFVSNRKTNKASKGASENSDDHKDRAARRARSRLRQLTLAAGCDHLVTLTYRKNVTDYSQSSNDLSRFIRKVRRRFPDWVFVAVPEKQKRGAWHWHLAVIGRQDVGFLREAWRSVVGEGNIDVKPPPKKGRKHRRMGIVAYLSKYLAKTFSEECRELNVHRYRSSQGIRIPIQPVAVPAEARANISAYAIEQLRQLTGDVSFVWVDESGMAGWACCWE